MLIAKAYAAAAENADQLDALADAPTAGEAFFWNIALVGILVFLFYILLIMPQQRRFKEHSDMLSDLKKGDRVITGGGLVGKIDKIIDDREVLIDLGNGLKVTALRSTIQGKTEDLLKPVANDAKAAKAEKK
ncbi:MAG: preprotein translocase subunit YajC [Alphaproteobacteria bacterium]|nr:preprotein translocase subunit YajC [Alphaproteobacteria bacterium]